MTAGLRKPSRPLLTAFAWYLRRYMRRHFHALRIAHQDRFPAASGESFQRIVVVLNHASWWDPLTCILLSRRVLPRAYHYAPMDAAELKRYRFFSRIGLFPVEQHSPRGAAQFLRAGSIILAHTESVLWVTPQGAFADVRERPPKLRPGLGSLICRTPDVTVVPLALEYIFWNERLPEILANWGEPIVFDDSLKRGQQETSLALGAALAETQDELSQLARSRNPNGFQTAFSRKSGVGGVYDLWLRFQARRQHPSLLAERRKARHQ